jgi:aminopeptidase N
MRVYGTEKFVGTGVVQKALLAYMQRWHGKHPLPYDFFFTINDVAKKNLDWFWKPWFFEYGYPDLAIESVTVNKDEVKVKIAKLGNVPTRVKVSLVFADGEVQTKELKADVWAKGDKAVTIKFVTNKKVAKVLLGDKHIPDSFRDNNIYEIR